MLDRNNMRDVAPHIENAHRCLEMLQWLAKNKKISLEKHVPTYFNKLVESVLEIQNALLEENEYTERVSRTLTEISKTHVYSWNVTQNNDGDTFYSIDAMLSAAAMKKNILVSGRIALPDLKERRRVD